MAMEVGIEQLTLMALNWVERIPLVDEMQAQLDDHPGPTGRVRLKSLAVALVVNAGLRKDQHISEVARTLRALPRDLRPRLGIPPSPEVVTYRQVWHLVHRLRRLVDRPADTLESDSPHADALALLSARLLDATLPPDLPLSQSFSLDGTDIETWARVRFDESGEGRPVRFTIDPDAGEGHRPGRNGSPKDTFFGYEDHLLVQARE
jgi:hypothetical protein